MEKHITTPITQKITKDLRSGDYVYITGEMYVARDAAHKRMIGTITSQRWSSNWLSRTYNSNKNGQVCPKTA